MRDLTIHEEDKKGFITNVSVEEGIYKVTYASGKVENTSVPVSEHNMSWYLNQMERQLAEYKEPFLHYVGEQCIKVYRAQIIGLLVYLVSIYLSFSVDFHIIMKIILVLLASLLELGWFLIQKSTLLEYDKVIGNVRAMEYYVANKEEFLIDGKPFGEENPISLVTLNSIDIFSSEEQLKSVKKAYEEDCLELTKVRDK